ncbi:N-alpha-acetyltransferase [Parastagonospora nodorum]|nr:N-alpha-acetyltransferase [Parastagonospora nodorum]
MADEAPVTSAASEPDTTSPHPSTSPTTTIATPSGDTDTDKPSQGRYISPYEGPNSLTSMHEHYVMLEKMCFPRRRRFEEIVGSGEDDYKTRKKKHYEMCDNLPPLPVPKRARRQRPNTPERDDVIAYPPPAYWDELKRQERLTMAKQLLEQDPLGFQPWIDSVLPGFLRFEFVGAGDLLAPWQLEGCLELVEKTSSADYKASSSGWKPKEKKKEMSDPKMVYLLLTQVCQPPKVEGFISFMFTFDDPPNSWRSVVYIYEVHLDVGLRGRGLGSKMIKFVELVAEANLHMKTMLTVFKTNNAAKELYERLGYSKDVSSPADKVVRRRIIEAQYAIMSKRVVEAKYTIMSKQLQDEY